LPNWYQLTDGWYWLDIGETRLFRYTPMFVASLAQGPIRPSSDHYVDYYVVELWESVMDIFVAMLEPIPSSLGDFRR